MRNYRIRLSDKIMFSPVEALGRFINALTLARLQEDNDILREKVAVLAHQLDGFKCLVFGERSERFVPESDTVQGSLFEALKPSPV